MVYPTATGAVCSVYSKDDFIGLVIEGQLQGSNKIAQKGLALLSERSATTSVTMGF